MIFDVIVVGGGHAGIEASSAAARIGSKTLLITQDSSKIGELSCNPSIGGIGRSAMIREIDVMGGLIGKCADASTIHSRVLNRSKGNAVWGLRAQIDRDVYKKNIKKVFFGSKNLTIVESEVSSLIIEDKKIVGVVDINNNKFFTKTLIITTGTFLDATIYIGKKSKKNGRIGCASSIGLARSLKENNFNLKKMRTGTPPRIDKESIDWDLCERQPTDSEHEREFFSFFPPENKNNFVDCFITSTNNDTHELVRKNIDKSSRNVFELKQTPSPRYCVSIDDKIFRFPNKESHNIFLEIESSNSNLVYPNGISTYLPEDIQQKMINTIKGMESAKIVVPGYCVVYDFVDPRELRHTLETKKIKNLFFAGQINGTTGYTEAAGQGLVAGINAALISQEKGKELVMERQSSYIGVMIDDLVTRGVNDPYRMFTSRAENRLFLRHDNADVRVFNVAKDLQIIGEETTELYHRRFSMINSAKQFLQQNSMINADAKSIGINVRDNRQRNNLYKLLGLKNCDIKKLANLFPDLKDIDEQVIKAIAIEAKYDPYINKEKSNINLIINNKGIAIPIDINYHEIKSLSKESTEKLSFHRPVNTLVAAKISSIRPSDIISIINYIKKYNKTDDKNNQCISR